MNTIEIKGLCKSYEGFSLDNLSLILPRGCIMGLIGENGAGKSTTIKLILNIIRRDSGEIKLFGEDNSNPALREDIGVVLDEVGIFSCLNAVNVGKIMSGIYKNWEDEVYNGYIERLELPKKKEFGDYSRGMKMKLGIAVALSHKPKLLILDEATSGLDPVVRDEVLNIFSEFTRDESCSVLISSHIVSDLEKICDYVAFLHKGKLILCEEKDILRDRYRAINCTPEELESIENEAVIAKKSSLYGVEAIINADAVPAGMNALAVDIEQLFISMIKGGRSQ